MIDAEVTLSPRGGVRDARVAFAARWLAVARADGPDGSGGSGGSGGEAGADAAEAPVRAALRLSPDALREAAAAASAVVRVDPADIADVVIVPGILGETVRALVAPLMSATERLAPHGVRTTVASVNGRTGCAANAATLRPIVLDAAARAGGPIHVIGYSKGCTDALHMLADHPDTRAAVRSLTSLSGVVHGTPLAARAPGFVDELLRRMPLPRVETGDGRALDDLEPARRAAHLAAHPVPEGIRCASVVSAASSGNVSRIMRGTWRALARTDPANDGQMIAVDAVLPRGELLAFVDADHWALALPLTERWPVLRPLVNRNDFPRASLLRALLEHLTLPVEGGVPISG